jgi:hypothetical protein
LAPRQSRKYFGTVLVPKRSHVGCDAMAEPNSQKPGDIPKDPFPIPAHPTQPPELTPSDPVNIPPPGQDVIFPANEPVGIPPAPDVPEPPGVF